MADSYDVIIIGSGAGGGTLAWKLAPSGKRVLLLERGDYLPRERDNWDSTAVFLQAKYTTTEQWLDRHGKSFTPEQNYYVGGNTKFYGAALFRLRPEDFGEITHYGGTSPAWPLSYEDFEPWYAEAERLYHVHGAAGEDPTDGPRSGDFPYPAVRHEPRIQRLSDDLVALGLHPAHLPIGVMLDQGVDGKAVHGSRCIRCDRVDGFPCPVNGKADAQTVCVDPALREHSNLELVTNAHVQRLETSADGRTVTALVASLPDGSETRFVGDLVVVSCGALNSSLLLLRSANEAHPNGLANSSDQLGRNYMRHNNMALMALSEEPNPTVFQKTLVLNDWYHRGEDWEYPWGSIQMLGKSDGEQLRGSAPQALAFLARLAPDAPLDWLAQHAVDFWLSSEDLPHPDSRVTLERDGTVRLSIEDENNTEPLVRLRKKFESMLSHLGMHDVVHHRNVYLHKGLDVSATAHQAGTARFGHDPSSSVLDLHCKAHDLDNLYVVDSSFFVSIGAVNPTLTIIANALRVGDHLVERLG
ncbi:MAG: NAD(P)-binding protein [Gemmatimonas sp.]|nr:NAD(P)-binding protein [Gemmatimonas sp.]